MFSSNGSQVSSAVSYIENVFSTYLYTGNGSTQTITNNIDLSTKGGLVWIKKRSSATDSNNSLYDTQRGVGKYLSSNTTGAEQDFSPLGVTNFLSSGFSIQDSGGFYYVNGSGSTYASWTFRKQPKFFDVVTYTGTGSATTIAHSLGSVPGCIIVKRTDTTANWSVYHQSLNEYRYVSLNLTTGETISSAFWNNTAPTSTNFTVGTDATVNASGGTYVAYLFASDAGGFGLTGTDNVITCGQFATNGAGNATVTLGYEPQWVMTKRRDSTGSWAMFDSMRGLTVAGSNDALLFANGADAEDASANYIGVTSTGLAIASGAYSPSATYIYIAIRRGPMAVPTVGTSVFSPTSTSASTGTKISTSFPVDLQIGKSRPNATNNVTIDRLRGASSNATESSQRLFTNSTGAEDSGAAALAWDNTGFGMPSYWSGSEPVIFWNFRRAPSFFDEVCYTGTGSARSITHNLGVAPELLIVKARSQSGGSWNTWTTGFTISGSSNEYVALNSTSAKQDKNSSEFWGSSYPTSSAFGLGDNYYINNTGDTYVAYLFATCAGVSKVGSYTGNGGTQAIACGFTGGARFVLIKCTSTTGGWYVYDTARGMTTLTDPYLFLNSTAAESATLGSVTTTTGGFTVNAAILAAINTSSATYIFFAVS